MNTTHQGQTCIFCGQQNFQVLFSVDEYRVCKCRHCHLVQTSPLPPEDTRDDLYDYGYFEKLTGRKEQERFYQQRFLDQILQYKRSGKMLEIGVGIGLFMELASQAGWKIEGLDPSRAACQYVTETYHLPTHVGLLSQGRFPSGYFDVLALRHVLEHVPTPLAFVKELHRIVKDDGIIAMAVPNFGGVHASLARERWFHLSLPYHVAHYTPKTLTMLLDTCGFEIVQLCTKDFTSNSYLIECSNRVLRLFKRSLIDKYMNPREIDPHKSLIHWLISKETILNGLAARLGWGGEIVVIAKKT